jgi:hypothetical protein
MKLSSTSISWGKTIIVAHIDFEVKSWCGLEINMAHTNRAIQYTIVDNNPLYKS